MRASLFLPLTVSVAATLALGLPGRLSAGESGTELPPTCYLFSYFLGNHSSLPGI